MIRHTHQVSFKIGDYSDSFLFTPSEPILAQAEARARIEADRSVLPHDLEVTELPSAERLRAVGKLCSSNGRHYYEIRSSADLAR